VFLSDISSSDPALSIPFVLSDAIKLDNGSAYLGFVHETNNLSNSVSIDHWTFFSTQLAN
jgi:hypothetical protein